MMDPVSITTLAKPALSLFDSVVKLFSTLRKKLVVDAGGTLAKCIDVLTLVEASYGEITKALEGLLNVKLSDRQAALTTLESAALGQGFANQVSRARGHCTKIKDILANDLNKVVGDAELSRIAAEFDLNDGEFIRSVEAVAARMTEMAKELLSTMQRGATAEAEKYLEDARSDLFEIRSEAAAGQAKMNLLLLDLQTAAQSSPIRRWGSA